MFTLLAAVAAGSCSTITTAPDTLCQLPRPTAALNDTEPTRLAQLSAAKAWDRQCTVSGWIAR